MGFLDNTGLSYFYGKLKEKFIRSVNSSLPDENGNVEITNVATADNLTSPDEQGSYNYYQYRTSGGSASLDSGTAQLIYIDGNMQINNRVYENFAITTTNDIAAQVVSPDAWRLAISESGTYYFTYTQPTSSSATSSSWTAQGTWTLGTGTAIIDLNTYGLSVTNIVDPSINITTDSSGITALTIVPSTFISQFSASGEYVFAYTIDGETGLGSWTYDNTTISLSSYGIEETSTSLAEGDIIIVTYQAGTPNSQVTVTYTAPEQGTISIPKPTKFVATGLNQFDKNSMVIANASISNNQIQQQQGSYIGYCKAVGGVTNGYVAYSSSGTISNIAYCSVLPSIGVSVSTASASVSNTLASIPFNNNGYVVVALSSTSDLCIHPRWSGAGDTQPYEEYMESEIALPTVDISGNPIPLGTYGIAAVGAISDRINLDNRTYIQKIGRLSNTTSNMSYVAGLNTAYDYDGSWIYYVLPEQNITTYSLPSSLNPDYTVNDWGTEEFVGTSISLGAYNLYGQNLRDKLRTDVLTISEQDLNNNQKGQIWNNLGVYTTDTVPSNGAPYGIYFVYSSNS